MEQFFQFNVGQIVQTLVVVILGIFALGQLRQELSQHGDHLKNLDVEVSEVRKVMVQIARQEERLSAVDYRLNLQGKRLDLLTANSLRYAARKTSEESETD